MEINPGGHLPTEEIVGRDESVRRYWQILARQGLILTGERRIGKTHIMWKMHSDGCPGMDSIYFDLEGIHSTSDLVRSIYGGVQGHLTKLQRLKAKAIGIWQDVLPKRIKDLELPSAAEHWKSLVSSAFADVASLLDGDKLVIMWDEFPLMIDNIAKGSGGANHAMQLLDLLRQLRQQYRSSLRFMFAGSIGLHIVLMSLRAQGHTNPAVNDMHTDTVPPLAEPFSIDLACRLLAALEYPPPQSIELARRIHLHVGGFPYYMHHVADQLLLLRRPPAIDDVDAAVQNLICGDHDPAYLAYYVDRINTYYGSRGAAVALAVLNAIALRDSPITAEELLNLTRHVHEDITDQELRNSIRLLRQDHYLISNSSADVSQLDFRWPFIKAWWRRTQI
jgi:hypothetical protein